MSSHGNFSLGHFVDPLGLTVGKGKGGGAKNFWDPASIFTGGSNTPSAQATAIAAAPVPTPAPPVTADAAEVMKVQQDLQRQMLAKKSIANTVWAGDTGGYRPGGSNAANMIPVRGGYRI